jgi:hypothetical protein
MRVLRKILPAIVVLALLYGGLLLAERMTQQELTRASEASTQEVVSLVWQPRLLRGDGICALNLLNAQGKVVDTARLGVLGAGFEALQQYGQLGFVGQDITVTNLRTGEVLRRFVVRDGRLQAAE